MEELVPLLNKLQDALVSAGVAAPGVLFDLPQIAVVGAQSVGKSSVLEALVGKQFLPNGTGIVTRRPLILQLRHARVKEDYGEFSHLPDRKFVDFLEIREEIQRETDRVGGKQKNVSPLPIFLRICSPNVIDLTLIDLPGITKVPVGDQPSDIELQVRRIVYQYISKPSAIILAVTAANTDIANSDSLKIAREVDPQGQRTVGVVTKIDTLEPGIDCVDLLCNRVIPLKHGYVGVVCRGPRQQPQRQQDGEEEVVHQPSSYRAASQAEAHFFRSHAAYAAIASQQGVPYLAKTLNRLLLSHVRQALPELRRKVAVLMQQTEAELTNYGDPLVEAKANPGALLLHFFSKFARNFQDVIDGKLQTQHTSEQLMGGARINFIFHDWYSRALAEFDPLEGLTDQEIRTAIRNATGPKAALFVPEGAFEILVRKQIQQLETPSLQCVDQVYEELQKIVEKCELPEMSRFACLRERVMEVVRGVLRRCLAPTYQMIHNIIQIELAYINTNHPDFMNNRFAVDSRPPSSQQCGSCSGSSSIGGSSGHNNCSSNGSSSGTAARWTRRQRQQQLPASPAAAAGGGATVQHIGAAHQQQSLGGSAMLSTSASPHRGHRTQQQQALPQQQQLQQSANYPGGGHAFHPSPSSPLPVQQTASCSSPRGGRQAVEQAASSAGGMLPPGGFFSFLKGGSRSQAAAAAPTAASGSSSSASSDQHNSKRQPPPSPLPSAAEADAPATYAAAADERISSGDFSPSSSRSSSRGRSSPPPPAVRPPLRQQTSRSLSGAALTSPAQGEVRCEGVSSRGGPFFFSVALRGGAIHLPQVPSVIAPSEVPSEREQIETDLIKSLIWSYFQIVRKNVADAVPKSVMYFMVNTAKDVLQRELVSQLYREELFSELLKEGEDICERRARCKQLLRSLRGAADILAQIRDYGSSLEECGADGCFPLSR